MRENICHEFRCVNNLIKQYMFCAEGEEFRPSFVQGGIIYLIKKSSEPVYQRDIEKKFNIRRSTATGILQNMEKNGLVTREPSKEDARLKQITLTKKANDSFENFEKKSVETEKKMIEGISQEELNIFFNVLEKIKSNLNILN